MTLYTASVSATPPARRGRMLVVGLAVAGSLAVGAYAVAAKDGEAPWRAVGAESPQPADDSPTLGEAAKPREGMTFEELLAESPDFVAVKDRAGTATVGYVANDSLSPGMRRDPEPVYADAGQTLVGHLHAGVGFVALDESLDAARADAEAIHASRVAEVNRAIEEGRFEVPDDVKRVFENELERTQGRGSP